MRAPQRRPAGRPQRTREQERSLRRPSPEQGWWCFGCQRGGTVCDLAALLEGGGWGRALGNEEFKRVKQAVWERLGIAERGRAP
jgi:hypothetical protein